MNRPLLDTALPDSAPTTTAKQTRRILFASLIGTTIEFFDFYIYATAAVLVFPTLFFPKGNSATALLQSLATFALAFFARPVGSALFGHFGDRIGRKATLVTALLTMGLSTVCIGLLATDNAPPGKQAWYGCFPQLGAPLGFLCSTGVFILLSNRLSEAQFYSWGWRVPFMVVFAKYPQQLVLGTLGTANTFVFLALGFTLTGLTYGPLGSALAKLFPTPVRYTGTSFSFNLAGILGASLAPPIATRSLAADSDHGVQPAGQCPGVHRPGLTRDFLARTENDQSGNASNAESRGRRRFILGV